MRKIKEAITDSAIANGYEGSTPRTIAQAVGAFAGVAGGGGGGGGGGYSYDDSAITDLVHEQTINIETDPEGPYHTGIEVDTQTFASIDGITNPNGVQVTCVIDGTEYPANASSWEEDNHVFYSIVINYNDPEMSGWQFATIEQDLDAGLYDQFIFVLHDEELIGFGDHDIHVYYGNVNVTFEQSFIKSLKDALGCDDGGTNLPFEKHEDIVFVMDPSSFYYTKGNDYDVTLAADVVEYIDSSTIVNFSVDDANIVYSGSADLYGGVIPITRFGTKILDIDIVNNKLYFANTYEDWLSEGLHTFSIYINSVYYDFDEAFINSIRDRIGGK